MEKIFVVTRYGIYEGKFGVRETNYFTNPDKAKECEQHMINVRGYNPDYIFIEMQLLDVYKAFQV